MLIHQELEITINTPSNIVWKVLAHEFDDIDRWSSGINKSEPLVPLEGIIIPDGARINGRVCDTVIEEFSSYDESAMRFTYKMANRPWFIRNITNTWSVDVIDPNQSVVTIEPEISVNIFLGLLMKLFMPLLKKLGTNTLEELKYYIENDKPHPRKLKAIEKFNKQS